MVNVSRNNWIVCPVNLALNQIELSFKAQRRKVQNIKENILFVQYNWITATPLCRWKALRHKLQENILFMKYFFLIEFINFLSSFFFIDIVA